MARYRSHLTRWHVLRATCLMAFGTAVCLYNLFVICNGLTSGAVKSFRRRSDDFVRLDTDPGWFGFIIWSRLIIAVLFAAAVVILWRKLRKERAKGVPD